MAPPEEPENKWKAARFGQDEDHSDATAALLDKVNATVMPVLLRSSNDTVDVLLADVFALEKKARLGGDTLSGQRLCVEVVRVYRTLGQHDTMLQQLDVLLKKRMQPKQVQSAMILEAQLVLSDDGVAGPQRIELLQRLKFLAEGKIHVELEHARFAVQLATLVVAESAGRKKEASDMLQSVQVETITNMPRLEKIDCILQQLRLALDIDDLQRVAVLARKINPRALAKPDTVGQRIRYFQLMVEYFERVPDAALLVARCWHEMYLTLPADAAAEGDDEDAAVGKYAVSRLQALSNCAVLLLTAPHLTEKEVDDLGECAAFSKESMQHHRGQWMKELLLNKDVRNELPALEKLLTAFTGIELIRAPMAAEVAALSAAHPMLVGDAARCEAISSRLSEHDVLVAAQFYQRVHMTRLAALVGLSDEATESFVMSLVTSKTIYARIDRIDGTVVFEKKANPVDVAKQWNEGVERITGLVERASHLVAKERMLRAATNH